MRQRNGKEAAETPPEQRERWRSGSSQMEAIGALDAFGELLLPDHEVGHDIVEGLAARWHQHRRRAESNPRRGLVRNAKQALEHRIAERARAVELSRARVSEGGVNGRDERAGRVVQMVEAFGDRSAIGCRPPVETRIRKARDDARHVLLNEKQLIEEALQLGVHWPPLRSERRETTSTTQPGPF